MKRLIALLSVAGLILLGLVAASAPASATFSGPNGQITFGLFNPAIGDDQIWKSNPDGSHPVQLTTVPSEQSDWSPDGSRIAFDFFDGQNVQIATMDTDGQDTLQLTTDETVFHGEPAYSPDGSRIAFEGDPVDAPDGIFLMDASNGQEVTRITSNPYPGEHAFDETPSFSPDGTQIVFDRQRFEHALGHQAALFVVRTDGSDLRRISPWGLQIGQADWSPSGDWIVFNSQNYALVPQIYICHPDGTGLRQLTRGTNGDVSFDPTWSPDGTKIMFSHVHFTNGRGQQDLWVMNADGTGLSQVTNTPEQEEFADWGTHPLAT
jgi:Tol biopolymer transport system component